MVIITRARLAKIKKELKNAKKDLKQLDKRCDNGTDDYVYSLDRRKELQNIIRTCREELRYYIN